MTSLAIIQQLRDEGVASATVSDARALDAIQQASDFIERVCGVSFVPTTFSTTTPLLLDGTGHDVLRFPQPILSTTQVGTVNSAGTKTAYTSTTYVTYNRRPPFGDDRRNPRIILRGNSAYAYWPVGKLNCYFAGVLGWCDAGTSPSAAPEGVTSPGAGAATFRVGSILRDDEDHTGRSVRVTLVSSGASAVGTVARSANENVVAFTGSEFGAAPSVVAADYTCRVDGDWIPREIQRAALILVINSFAPLLGDADAQSDRLRRWLISETTEGHSYRLSDLAASSGASGITEVDAILRAYRRPIVVRG